MSKPINTKLVLVRHGQSRWNKENRFTGWRDVDLSDKGIQEAQAAGDKLKKAGYQFDLAYTSVLKRAIKTLWIVMEKLDQMWIPVTRDWRLNERHYGGLTGLNKEKTAKLHGKQQVHLWRRSYDIRPPALAPDSAYSLDNDPRYAHLPNVPDTECLKDTLQRVVPIWEQEIFPKLKGGNSILISAHGNSLRAIIKHLSGVSDADITGLEVPTGAPLAYRFDELYNVIGYEYLE